MSLSTFYTEGSIKSGVYRFRGVSEGDGFVEVGPGILVEVQYGCFSAYSYGIPVWSGYGGEMCTEDEFDPNGRSCP